MWCSKHRNFIEPSEKLNMVYLSIFDIITNIEYLYFLCTSLGTQTSAVS